MAAIVECGDRKTIFNECVDENRVASRVFAEPVNDCDDAPDRSFGLPGL
jgi:hypothetical protein